MPIRTILSILVLCLCVTMGFAEKPDFPKTLQNATDYLAGKSADPATAVELSNQLLTCVDTYPTSSLVAEALISVVKINTWIGKLDQAAAAAKKIVEDQPESDFTAEAYRIAWNYYTQEGKKPLAGVDLTLNLAHKLGKTATALDYYKKSIEIYRDAKRWKEATEVGIEYLANLGTAQPYPPILITLADVALKEGNTALAKESLESFIQKFGTLPHAVTARTELGMVYSALGDENAANENYSLAWTTFQKNRSKSEYNQEEITQAAAEALWQMQIKSQRQFEEKTAFGTTFKAKTVRQMVEGLTKGFDEVALTDPEYAARAFNATGDTYSRFADLLLQDGYRTSNANGITIKNPPFAAAMPEYTRAIAAYSRASEQATLHGNEHENKNAGDYAATRTFELTAGQGDILFAWAMDLEKHGTKNQKEQQTDKLNYMAANVLPVLNQALTYKQQALDFADRSNLASQAMHCRKSLDNALKPAVEDLFTLCREDWNMLKANSTQLASAYTRSSEPAMAKPITESVASSQTVAKSDAEKCFASVTELHATLQKCKPLKETRDYWNDALLTIHNEYASVCQTTQTYLEVCQTSAAKANTENAQLSKEKLTKLQTACSTEEYATLARAYELASQYNIAGTTCDRLLGRLAELDPRKYGNLQEINSASRKRP